LEDLVRAWKGRRVFVTGHTGFKGGWLALWLARLGAEVRGYGLEPSSEPNLFTVAGVGNFVVDVRGDIRDIGRLQATLSEFAPDVVFHLAAQPLVLSSYADPLGTFATNVLGTANVLEAVRHTESVRAVVCVTTDKCYENREWLWPYRETDRLGGYDPYSSSKACAELVTAAYRNSFFGRNAAGDGSVAVATARAGNVIGGGDWSEHRLVPDLIRGFEAGIPVRIRRPNSTRPWQHVLEPLHGYLRLAERLLSGDAAFRSAFNFGPGDEDCWTVERIVMKMAGLWGDGAKWICEPDSGAHEAAYLRLDSSKARAQLQWHPRLDLAGALEKTLAWYKARFRGEDMGSFTLRQIEEYERLGNNPVAQRGMQ
jgi:CDP-glucose 4,6-dehydratase